MAVLFGEGLRIPAKRTLVQNFVIMVTFLQSPPHPSPLPPPAGGEGALQEFLLYPLSPNGGEGMGGGDFFGNFVKALAKHDNRPSYTELRPLRNSRIPSGAVFPGGHGTPCPYRKTFDFKDL